MPTEQVKGRDLITDIVKFEDAERAFQQVKAGASIKTLTAGVED